MSKPFGTTRYTGRGCRPYDAVVRVRADRLTPLDTHSAILNLQRRSYIVAAARISDALAQDILLARLEAPVIPLPH